MPALRGGKIGLTRWASPVYPELGPGWAIKLLARKKQGQIWPGLIWPRPVWPDPTWPPEFFLPSKGYLARPAWFLGRVGLLKFWPVKYRPILARFNFGPAHYWPGPTRPGPPDCQLYLHCHKRHLGICRWVTGGCFRCGSTNHLMENYPQGSGISRNPQGSSRGGSNVPPLTSNRGRGRGSSGQQRRGIVSEIVNRPTTTTPT